VGCLDPRELAEREEFLAGFHSPTLLLELEKKSSNSGVLLRNLLSLKLEMAITFFFGMITGIHLAV
jgi:hypothetical protein